VILRPQTEWVEIVEAGAAILADADEKRIKDACKILLAKKFAELPPLYGDGKAAEFICGEMLKWLA
jgi:UDP-GlcNAc3NAcA epimerase